MRVLVATVPLTGHVRPMLSIARALVERGHEVVWYGGAKFAPAIEALGARFAPMRAARDWDDADVEAALPALRGKRGLARVKTQLREMFIAPMLDQLRDLEALRERHAPAVVLADQAHLGAALLAEKHAVPWAGLGISTLVIPSADTAPFGAARPPPRNDVDRAIYRALQWVVQRWLFRAVNRAYRDGRVAAGLPAGTGTYFDVLARDLYLQPTIPAFEYPRRDLPPQVRFIGPVLPREPETGALPIWWPELLAARDRGTPIVLVTQGTLATDPRELVGPALRALADEDVFVVATTPARPDDLGGVPANARLAAYIPYQQVLSHARVLVTNGGYGGVQMALASGVPLVVAGGSEEKPEIAARVAWSGVGIDLRTGRPRAGAIRRAVRRVIDDDAYRTRARELAADCAHHDAPVEAAALIESLADGRIATSSVEAA